MSHKRKHIFDLTPDELADLVDALGMPRFRAKQVLEWVYAKGVADPQAMTNLSQLGSMPVERDAAPRRRMVAWPFRLSTLNCQRLPLPASFDPDVQPVEMSRKLPLWGIPVASGWT